MKRLLCLLVATMITVPIIAKAHGPTRQQVIEEVIINSPPEKVWAVVKDFGGLHIWHPAIVSTTLKDDNVRVLELISEGNPTITEKLLTTDDSNMLISYKITNMTVVKTITFNGQETPYFTLPVSTYKAWITVEPANGGSKVKWKAKFYRSFMSNPPTPEGQSDKDAVNTVKSVITVGLENLKVLMEK